jgi:hypothetical protein
MIDGWVMTSKPSFRGFPHRLIIREKPMFLIIGGDDDGIMVGFNRSLVFRNVDHLHGFFASIPSGLLTKQLRSTILGF